MARLGIMLLGSFRVTVDGVPVTGFHSDKVRALLAYLAIEADRPHRRETLAGLLWPGYPEHRARRNLSQALYDLRRALAIAGAVDVDPSVLEVSLKTVEFHSAACDLDVARLVSLAEASPRRESTSGPKLTEAVRLYAGELLAGFSMPDSPEFEEWLEVERERLRRIAVDALSRLVIEAESRSDVTSALVWARRWVETDALNEQAHRAIMHLLAATGERSTALAQYERCRRLLREELGIEPEAATTALAERIRAGGANGLVDSPAAGSTPGESADLMVRTSPFLGAGQRSSPSLFVARESELAQLQGYLDRALRGTAQVAFVAGEAGSGKSALVNEFARRALDAGKELVAVTGRCNAHTGIGDPYLAWREILSQLTGDVQERWSAGAMSTEEAERLWALVPYATLALAREGADLVGRLLNGEALLARAEAAALPGAAWTEELRGVIDRSRAAPPIDLQQIALFQQVTLVLGRLAHTQPLLLLLEDLHWADAGSLSLLFHLGLQLSANRVMILGTYRPTDLADVRTDDQPVARHPLEPVLNELQRRYGEIIVDLAHADGRHLINALLDCEPNTLGAGFREALYGQSGGNALFATELLHALRERGDLRQDSEGRWTASGALCWDLLPARVGAVIAERVGRLPPFLQEALRVASVEGETFTVEAVARVLAVEPLALVRSLAEDAARRHSLIAAAGTSRSGNQPLTRYRFRHILIQSRLYDGLDAAERSCLHGAVGDALLSLYADEEGDIAVQLARHYEEAGAIDRAVTYLRQAGFRASLLAAYREAEALYTHGLALLESLPEGPNRDRCELDLLILLATALHGTEGYAGRRLHQACVRARELSGRVGSARDKAAALEYIVSEAGMSGDWRSAQRFLEEGLAALRRSGARAYEAGMRLLGAFVYVSLGDLPHVVAETEQALALVDAATYEQTTGTRGMCWKMVGLQYTSWALAMLGYPDQAMGMRRRALDLADRLDSPLIRLGALGVAGAAAPLALRLYDVALEAIQEEQRLAEEWGNSTFTATALAQAGQAELGMGQVQAAIGHLSEGIARLRAEGARAYLCGYQADLAAAYGSAGEVDVGLNLLAEAQAIMARSAERSLESELHRVRGELLLALGPPNIAGAEAAYLQAIAVAQRQEARLFELRSAVALGCLWQSQGRDDEARALLQPMYDWFTEGFDTPDLVDARALFTELKV